MAEWQKTACVLCAQNCGLEVLVEDNRMVKVRPDKDNPRSQGYVCRKGLKVAHSPAPCQRLLHPLKRVGTDFERISWDQAIDEIAEKLQAIVDDHGPRARLPTWAAAARAATSRRPSASAAAAAGLPLPLQRPGPGTHRALLGLGSGHRPPIPLDRARSPQHRCAAGLGLERHDEPPDAPGAARS